MNTSFRQHKVNDFYILEESIKGLTTSEEIVLGCLVNYSLVYRRVFPSIQKIAQITKLSSRTVQRAIRKLVAFNFVKIVRESGWNSSNNYVVNFRLKMKKFRQKIAHALERFWSGLPENVTLMYKYKCKYKIKEVLESRDISASKKVQIFRAYKTQDEEYVDTQLNGWATDLIEYWKGLLAAKTSRFFTKKEKVFAKMVYPEKEAKEFNGVIYSSSSEQPIDVNMLELFHKTEQAEISQCKEEITIKEQEIFALKKESGVSDVEKKLIELNKKKYDLFVGIIGKTLSVSLKEKYNEEIRNIEIQQKELEAQKSNLAKVLEAASMKLRKAEENLATVKFEAKERRLREGLNSFVG